jgi:hypothetical protein
MSPPSTTCKVCVSIDQDAIEASGLRALAGEISWRACAREIGWTNYHSVKNHMENHYVRAQERAVQAATDAEHDDMTAYIEDAVRELQGQFAVSPPEVKPLILAAIHNIRELRNTKPSQQHLIQSLKTIQEMTGMKQEQRMMLLFAERMFGEVGAPPVPPALPDPDVIDVEVLEDEPPLPDKDAAPWFLNASREEVTHGHP